MSDIKLNFVNRSNDQNNSEVVIFQKNVATDFDELSVVWRVIKNCAQGWSHEFTYPMSSEVSASDSWGNQLKSQLSAQPGQLFEVFKNNSGDQLSYKGPCTSPNEIQVKNSLSAGSVDAQIYKDGKLLAVKTDISPNQKAVFEFKPTLWVGVASQVEEGEVINSAILSSINTELDLLGLSSADLVMTGGGTGKNATPFQFSLENVVRL